LDDGGRVEQRQRPGHGHPGVPRLALALIHGHRAAALVALDRQVYFPGDVSKGFRFELEVEPGPHTLTVMLGGNARSVPIDVEADRTYEIPLKFGGRWAL